MRIGIIGVVAVFVLLGVPSPSHAYLDPGTGSMLLQGLIGGIVALATFISIYWNKIKTYFKTPKNAKKRE